MTVSQEYIAILMMTSGVLFWSLGGTLWKGFRRFILPAVIGGLLIWYGIIWFKALLSSVLFIISACMPYGDSTPWFKPNEHGSKLITALALTLPAIPLGTTWFYLVTPVVFLLTFWASNSFLHKSFPWKVCEGATGLMVILTIISALQNQWGG